MPLESRWALYIYLSVTNVVVGSDKIPEPYILNSFWIKIFSKYFNTGLSIHHNNLRFNSIYE